MNRTFTRRFVLAAAFAGAAAVTLGQAVAADMPFITVQSTTSTLNSGLYDYLLPIFQKEKGIEVRVVAVGTGQAIKNARNGDGDVLLVHAKSAEEKFVADGFGVKRSDLMYNDFVIVGPADDPAGVAGMSEVKAAMKKIAASEAPFASRGDDSGTHKKERSLWKAAGVEPAGGWYRETGSGMGATLNTGIGMGAYVMTDRATWIKFGNKGDYQIAVEGDAAMFNQYGIIAVNPEKHPHVKVKESQVFIDWMLSPAGQEAIGAYMVDGKQLFFPNADKAGS
ncbi:sulfate transporter [Hwanghaeella grinnelliae]|uniref:Sulfate transporter n=1 Tax=Hwanghaeella grinnelliae TaxID=2500179 RepID=A0A3S2Z552_9PROT|nr:substrate-binding domain-containing protein [Hwanghaeella grinnelliae]RVU34075.1 sulfate transporter [Hwanghaeella grinnelliae]